MANAKDLISFAMAAVNRQPPLLYGQRAINNLSQRGPDSYDCIGFYRWCVLSIAPNLWPTSWGGEDSWTVPNYWGNVQGHFLIDNGPALAGDALIWIDNHGIQQHIAISDGKGGAISALNTIKNICVVQASSINFPILKVLHTGLEQKVATPGIPTATATVVAGSGGPIYLAPGQLTSSPKSPGSKLAVRPAWWIVTDAGPYLGQLIADNDTAWSILVPLETTDIAILQAKITKAISDLS